jgi:hypothetical protein
MAGWNYRVMRHEQRIADNDEVFYAIHEVYYKDNDEVKGWTANATGSPCGETMQEMIRDLAWIMTALAKPVLDAATGKEIEPAAMLADDLAKMLRDAPAKREEAP